MEKRNLITSEERLNTDIDQEYWNIIKGLGIIAVVVGHTGGPLTPYIYMYHLALFFFVSGYLYKEKYSSTPFVYLMSRFKRLWLPMVKYGVLFSLLHNFFIDINIYSTNELPGIVSTAKVFSNYDLLISIQQTLLMRSLELIGCAMWFIHPLLIAMIAFSIIRKVTSKFSGWKRELIVAIIVLSIYLIGIDLIQKKIGLIFNSDISMIVLPIIYMGFLIKLHWNKLPLKWYLGIISLMIVVSIYTFTGVYIDLSSKQIIGPKWFLLASFSGIYFNLVLGKMIHLSKKLSYVIAYIGKSSFHIMALHLLMFKLVNLVYISIYNLNYSYMAMFPKIDPSWWAIYSLVGIGATLICIKIYGQITRVFYSLIQGFNHESEATRR